MPGVAAILLVIGLMLIPLGLFVVLPVLNLVFEHQRKLAGIASAGRDQQLVERVGQLEQELHDLRDRLNEHALALDDHRRLEIEPRHQSIAP